MPTQNVFDGDLILEQNEGRLIWRNIPLGIDVVRIIQVPSDPNGVLAYAAPLGSFAVGPGGPWVNIDGATGWMQLAGFPAPVNVPAGTNIDIPPGTSFVTIETTDWEPLLFLPPIGSVPDGSSITFRIIEGFLGAYINPNNPLEGVNGPPASNYFLDAVEQSVTFRVDAAHLTWWKVS